MIGGLNTNPLDIFTSTISVYPFVTAKKIYTMAAAGADFLAVPPRGITLAHIILPGTPAYRTELKILDDEEWGAIALQDIPGAIPGSVYPDGGWPVESFYFYPQPPAGGYAFELVAWQRVPSFVALTDIVDLPDGYEEALTYNLAKRVASYFKSQGAQMSEGDLEIARNSLALIESRNAPVPHMKNDAAGLSRHRGGDSNWWRTGGF